MDETLWNELEELLISADVGVATATKLLERVKERMGTEGFTEGYQIRSALKEEMVGMLRVNA
ncbi:MAG: signal recognition particle receptor subunit alpha, partial [Dehalococcoidia bacterium]|nr:signal recognition particle receptor subunit alpha [Dehalococcoidia bacterium]